MAASFQARIVMGCGLTMLAALAPSLALHCLSPAGASWTLEAAGLAAGLALGAMAALALSRILARPVDLLASGLQDLTQETATLDAIATAQRDLDTNIEFLQSLLYGRGDPVRVGDKLYFGDLLVNGNNEIVDKVQTAHGGRATVCLGDLRLCTNITDASGKRMTGTRLAQGAAYDAIFKQGVSFRGETDLFGERYIAIYEPVLWGHEVIGLIFVAVSKARAVETTGQPAGQPRAGAPARMAGDIATLRALTTGKHKVMHEALDQRYILADARRKTEAQGRAAALAQLKVVTALSAALERLADADLTHRIDADFPQEYQKLKDDFGAAIEALGETMRAIMGEAHSMRGHSSEIATAVDELSRRTEQQAASLEQTAASLNIITSTVKRTAEGVSEARRVVTSAKTDAEHSSQIVGQAVEAMSAIENSSNKISQIITVIDDIALQTNLLALNAGVEAARAGDAGRGFAVVASEVRALAQRSAEAAKEIKDLIRASTRQVTHGVTLVGETGRSLVRIVEQVAEVDGIVATISETAREQAVSLQEVNTAITHMDRATQQNAAMVEESTAASHHLAQEAVKLQKLVGQFRTGTPAPVSRPAAASKLPQGRPAAPGAAAPWKAKAAAAGGWDEF